MKNGKDLVLKKCVTHRLTFGNSLEVIEAK